MRWGGSDGVGDKVVMRMNRGNRWESGGNGKEVVV